MRFNAEANPAGQASFAKAMRVKKDGMDDRQAAAAAADAIEHLFKGLGLPVRLSEVGVPGGGIDVIAEDAMTDFGLHRNVRKIENVDELKGILASVK
jgi:alcohol dehydrogenase class IV